MTHCALVCFHLLTCQAEASAMPRWASGGKQHSKQKIGFKKKKSQINHRADSKITECVLIFIHSIKPVPENVLRLHVFAESNWSHMYVSRGQGPRQWNL